MIFQQDVAVYNKYQEINKEMQLNFIGIKQAKNLKKPECTTSQSSN